MFTKMLPLALLSSVVMAVPADAAPRPYRSGAHRAKAHVSRSTWSRPALTVKW